MNLRYVYFKGFGSLPYLELDVVLEIDQIKWKEIIPNNNIST